jgi:hypothetical protein
MGRTAPSQIDSPDINLHAIVNQVRQGTHMLAVRNLGAINPRFAPITLAATSRFLSVVHAHLLGDARSLFDAMASDTLYFRLNLFALLFLALSLLATAKSVSQPGDWVAIPKVGVPNSWAIGNERIADGDPLQKIEPEVRNKHRENVPVLRKVDGECDCAEPTMCRRDRLTSESVRSSFTYFVIETDELNRSRIARRHIDSTAIGATLPVLCSFGNTRDPSCSADPAPELLHGIFFAPN